MCTAKPRGKPVELGPAYFRRCIAARVAARQKALDLAGVVDSFEGNRNRKWRGDGSILNDDRRIPILWATTEVGLKYDCYSALLTVFEDYQPVLEIVYRYMRGVSSFYPGVKIRDEGYEHHSMFPEMLCCGGLDPAAPAAEVESFVGPSLARVNLGNDVFIVYDRRPSGPPDTASLDGELGGGGPLWIPEAASCITSTAPVNRKVARWLVDTGSRCDLAARSYVETKNEWVRKAVKTKSFQTDKLRLFCFHYNTCLLKRQVYFKIFSLLINQLI